MPFFRAIRDEFEDRFTTKNAASGNDFVGFQSNGAVVLRDRRGTLKAEIPNVTEKSETLGDASPTEVSNVAHGRSREAGRFQSSN
jgi:hypothetical protein